MKALLVVPVLILLAIVYAILWVLKNKKGAGPTGQYEKQTPFLSPAEHSFLGVLEPVIQGQFRILCKVRLADIVKVKGGLQEGRQSAFNRIQSKHVDFVICDKNSVEVVSVVELDDKSHEREDRRERDALVDEVLKQAGVPIFHFSVKRTYAPEDVRKVMFQ